MTDDPVEMIVAAALSAHGIMFVRSVLSNGGEVDFHLPDQDLLIEVTQFYTPRKIKQMARHPNCILIQGRDAARGFAALRDEAGAR